MGRDLAYHHEEKMVSHGSAPAPTIRLDYLRDHGLGQNGLPSPFIPRFHGNSTCSQVGNEPIEIINAEIDYPLLLRPTK